MYFVVEMPVNKDMQGPEMDPSLVEHTFWEIWDENLFCFSVYDSKEEADYNCSILNNG